MNTEPTLPPMPEIDLPEGDWFEKDLYVKKFATDYAKAALAATKQADAERDTLLNILLRARDAIEALDGTSVENEKLVDEYRAVIARS